jgi:uncharacterized metal-binding protein YceD (DUF177 family)
MSSTIDLPGQVEIDFVKCRKRLDCFTQVQQASISNVAAKKEENRRMYLKLHLQNKVEVDCAECRKKLDCLIQVL